MTSDPAGDVRLIRVDPELERVLEGDPEYTEAIAREDWPRVAEAVRRAVEPALAGPGDADDELHWGGYSVVDPETGRVVGSCAFKGPPTDEGAVEIAYFTHPGFEGRGYATRMATKLIELASRSSEVHRILAHTLPEPNASTRVLEKVGMTFVGEGLDPEDGRVWRWQVEVAAAGDPADPGPHPCGVHPLALTPLPPREGRRMPNSALQEQIAAARAYEELHVPALFGAWTGPVLDAADISPGQRVLDVACGTGVLARTALERVGTSGAVVGVDPNPGMLAVAEELISDIEWRAGTAEELPFLDASFDAVVSQFGLMFFSDPSAAAREMGRVLRPGGALAVAVWDALESSPAYARSVELLDRLAGPAAADALRAPFALGDRGELAALFENAGLASVEVLTRTGRARFPSIRVMVEADLRGWLPVLGVELSDEKIEEILTEAEAVLAPYVTQAGRVEFDQPAHIVVGRGAVDEDDPAP